MPSFKPVPTVIDEDMSYDIMLIAAWEGVATQSIRDRLTQTVDPKIKKALERIIELRRSTANIDT
jgi:hypothetical protein